jgi:hypothetical protein
MKYGRESRGLASLEKIRSELVEDQQVPATRLARPMVTWRVVMDDHAVHDPGSLFGILSRGYKRDSEDVVATYFKYTSDLRESLVHIRDMLQRLGCYYEVEGVVRIAQCQQVFGWNGGVRTAILRIIEMGQRLQELV